LSALASIGVTVQLASTVLQQDYTRTLAAIRQSETQRAGLLGQLKRVRTPEEESGLRDKLAQADPAIKRERDRLSILDQFATRLQIAMPRPDETAAISTPDDALPAAYLVQIGVADATPDRLMAAILRTNDLSVRLKTLQDRASQASIALPAISHDQEAVMAQVRVWSPIGALATARLAWEASLSLFANIVAGGVFLWWIFVPAAGLGALGVVRQRARQRARPRR
jgi:hypothetical protein